MTEEKRKFKILKDGKQRVAERKSGIKDESYIFCEYISYQKRKKSKEIQLILFLFL